MTSHLNKSHLIKVPHLGKTKALTISSSTIGISNYYLQSTKFLPDWGSNPCYSMNREDDRPEGQKELRGMEGPG